MQISDFGFRNYSPQQACYCTREPTTLETHRDFTNRMAPKIQWKLRHLFAITTAVGVFFGLLSYLNIPLADSATLASALVLHS